MEGIFSLPYSEYSAILQVQKMLKKKRGYSVFIPVSRQQKGVDFLILNCKNNAVLRIQVKSSRAYESSDAEQIAKGKKYKYTLWFNNFIDRFESAQADWYLLFGLYPIYSTEENIKSREKFWRSVILAFSDDEMKGLLERVKTKQGKKGRFFYIVFNSPLQIYGTRLFPKRRNLTQHLLSSRKADLIKGLR